MEQRRSLKLKYLILCGIILLSMGAFLLSQESWEVLKARQGTLEISPFRTGTLYALEGEWRYYPQVTYQDLADPSRPRVLPKLRPVPHLWQEGLQGATYTLEVRGLQPDGFYGIALQQANTAYTLRVNDAIILANGEPGRESSRYRPWQQEAWGAFQADREGSLRITLEIANRTYRQGGFTHPVVLGDLHAISWYSASHKLVDTSLILCLTGLGAFFLAMALVYREEKGLLSFGIFSLAAAFRILASGSRLLLSILPDLSFSGHSRILYLSGFLLLPLFGLLHHSLGLGPRRTWERRAWQGLLAFSFLLPLLVSFPLYEAYYLFLYRPLILLAMLFFLLTGILGARRREEGSVRILLGYGFLGLGVLGELLETGLRNSLAFGSCLMIGMFASLFLQRIRDSRKSQHELELAAFTDKLTGAFNRRYLEQLIQSGEALFRKGEDWQVIFLDLDRFKAVNDTYGHEAGDLALKWAAGAFRRSIRDRDYLIRYGGDEFLVLAQAGRSSREEILERLRRALEKPMEYMGREIPIQASLGATGFRPGEESLGEAILRSDHQMYEVRKLDRQGSGALAWKPGNEAEASGNPKMEEA